MKLVMSLSLVFLLMVIRINWQVKNDIYSLDAERLQKTKSLLKANDKELLPIMLALAQDAESALKVGPFSVTQKELQPPSGDRHDYFSLAPYWWPDPNRKDGLPYIRRDGERNPDSRRGTDASLNASMAGTVETLATAYYFTGEERYAERAALLIRTWFLNPDTKMNPNFLYAQAVPGHNDGRAAGLIESRQFIKIVDSVGLLSGSGAWMDKDQKALITWFREFIKWMQISTNGKGEADAKNNHGSWYAAQLACFALFTGDKELARKTVEGAYDRIAMQIEPDGKQPNELQRTRALSYSIFNITALMTLAEAGKKVGVDLYHFGTKDGRSIRRAIDYLLPYADPMEKWPYQQINGLESARGEMAYLMRRSALAFAETKYEPTLNKYLRGEAAKARWQLLWPR